MLRMRDCFQRLHRIHIPGFWKVAQVLPGMRAKVQGGGGVKIVDLDTFLRMPAGTVFAPYEPCVFRGRFRIKTDTGSMVENTLFGEPFWGFLGVMSLEPDFVMQDECGHGPFECGQYKTEWCISDDSTAEFMDEEMFAVFEPDEVLKLIKILKWALRGCEGEVETDG